MHLDAERAADVTRDDADAVFFQPVMGGKNILDHVRALVVVPDGQLFFRGFIIGDETPCFQANAGVSSENECILDDVIRRRIGGVHIAKVGIALPRQIVTEAFVDDLRIRVERGFGIDGDGQDFPVDLNHGGGVFGFGATIRDDGHDGLSLPAGGIQRQRVLRRGFEPLQMSQDADPGRADFRHFLRCDHGDNAGHGLCRCRVDPVDFGVCIGRPDESGVYHPFELNVVDERSFALSQARRVGAGDRTADIGIRAIENPAVGDHVGHAESPFAPVLLPVPLRAISTASTMA